MDTARHDRENAREQRKREERIAPVIARIREDARKEPRRYIEESEVPGGGE